MVSGTRSGVEEVRPSTPSRMERMQSLKRDWAARKRAWEFERCSSSLERRCWSWESCWTGRVEMSRPCWA